MKEYIKASLACCLLLLIGAANAKTLAEILQTSLANDPGLAEAHANERIAGSRLEQTVSSRWPVISASGGQRVLSTKSDSDKSFVPTLKSTWTVYDFGKNEAEVARDDLKVDYYSHKTAETAEELIYEISSHYLEALKAKRSLDVAQANLQRHHEIKRMLEVIFQYDPGRRSELTQATSRLLKVESDITNYQRSLGLSLLRLARYVSPAVTVSELTDPFTQLTPNDLVDQYKAKESDLQAHPSYIAQQKELNSIAAELSLAERSRWPSLDVVGIASTDETAVYLNFDVELFNKKTSPAIDEKRHQITAAQSQLEQIRRNLTERSRLAELKMFQDQSRLFIINSQIKELHQVAMDYEDQFSIAKRSLLDVVNAYRELATVDLFKVETQHSLMVAKLDYLSAVGALRSWAGVGDKGLMENQPLVTNLDAPEKQQMKSLKREPAENSQAIQLQQENIKNTATSQPTNTSPSTQLTENNNEQQLQLVAEKNNTDVDLAFPDINQLVNSETPTLQLESSPTLQLESLQDESTPETH